MSDSPYKVEKKAGRDDDEPKSQIPRQDSISTKSSDDYQEPIPSAVERGLNDSDLTPALAAKEIQRTEAALGDAVLRFLKIRKGEPRVDPDAVSLP